MAARDPSAYGAVKIGPRRIPVGISGINGGAPSVIPTSGLEPPDAIYLAEQGGVYPQFSSPKEAGIASKAGIISPERYGAVRVSAPPPPPPQFSDTESALNQLKQYGYGSAQALGMDVSPEKLEQLKSESERQTTKGRMITDLGVGVPLQIGASAIPFTGGPVLSGGVAGGLQAGMLPVQPGESRKRNMAVGSAEGLVGGKVGQVFGKVVAPVVQPAKTWLGGLANKAIGAVESKLTPEVSDAVNKATSKFGFKLLPGQKSGVTDLRRKETGYRQKNIESMSAVQTFNQRTFNNHLAREMGVPDASAITPKVEATAISRVKALENKAYGGKTLFLDTTPNGTFTTAIHDALQNSSVPATEMFGPRAVTILQKASKLSQMSGDEFKWLRSELQERKAAEFRSIAAGSRDRGKALGAIVDALDNELDLSAERAVKQPNGSFAHGTFTPDDLKIAQEARKRWKGILTARDSKRGEYDIDPNAWAAQAAKWYKPGEAMHDLVEVIDNVPDFRASVGMPATIAPKGNTPFVSATVSPSGINARAGEGMGGWLSGMTSGPYMSLSKTNYMAPAEIKRRALAQLLGLTASTGTRESPDYVTRR